MRQIGGSKGMGLLAVAGVIAVQVPTTLALVEPPTMRVVGQLATLVVVVVLAVFVSPREVQRTVARWSGRPPPPPPPSRRGGLGPRR